LFCHASFISGFSAINLLIASVSRYSLASDGIFGMSSRGRGSSNVLKECLACVLANPSSKAGMSRWLLRSSGKELPPNRIYRMMDGLSERTERVKRVVSRETASLPGASTALMLFDVTTLYFESFEPDELRKSGFSKDNRIKETQVVLALAVTPEGFPLWYEIFPGNTFEGHTLLPVLKKCGEELRAGETVVVADRAMFTEENLRLLEEAGYSFVVSAKLRSLKESVKKKILSAENYTPLPERNILETLVEDGDAEESGKRRTGKEAEARRVRESAETTPGKVDGGTEDPAVSGEAPKAAFRSACWYALAAPPPKEKKKAGAGKKASGTADERAGEGSEGTTEGTTEGTAEGTTGERIRQRTLVVTWSPKRARKDAFDRERLLARLEKQLGGGGLKGKNLVKNRGTAKYLSVRNGEERDVYVVDAEKIEK